MADKIIIDGDTSGAIAALDRLQAKLQDTSKGVGNVMDKMQNLAAALAASLTAAGYAAAEFADNITDLAKAHGLAIGEVLALGTALAQNGGHADDAGKALQKLSNAVDDANGGNLKLVQSFGKMGISMADLGSKSSSEIRDKLLDSLAAIPDAMERNARATDFFGKALNGVDIVKFAEDQKKGREEMEKYAPALKSAGDAFDNLGAIAFKTKIAFAEAFKPLFDIIKELNPSVDELVIKFRLMAAVMVAASAGAIANGFIKIYEAIKLINIAMMANPAGAFAKGLAFIGIAAATYLGLSSKIGSSTDENSDKIKEQEKAVNNVGRSQEGYNKKIQDTKDKLSLVSAELQKNLGYIQEKLNNEIKYLGMTQDEIKIAQQKADIDKATADAKYNLEKQYQALSIEEQTATKAHHAQVLAGLDAQGKKAKDNAEATMQANQALFNSYKQLQDIANVAGNSQKTIFEAQTKFAISRIRGINEEIDATAKVNAVNELRANLLGRVSQLAESDRSRAIAAINDITTNTDYLAGSFSDVSTAMQKAFANYDLGANGAKNLVTLTKEPFNEFQKGAEKVALVNRQISDQSRTFADGWGQAFKEYSRAAGDSAAFAGSLFKKFTQGIEDNLVSLIKDGKSDWKGFVSSLGEELLRNQIKQGLSGAMSFIGDALKDQGGMLGTIGKFFGIGGNASGGADGKSENSALWVRTSGSGGLFGSSAGKTTDPIGGITKQVTSIFDSLKKTLGGLTDSVSNIFGGISSSLGNVFGGITDTFSNIFGGLSGGIGDIISSLANSVGGMFSGGGGGGGGGGFLDSIISGVSDFFGGGDLFSGIASLFGFAKGGLVPTNGPVMVGENGPEILTGAGGRTVIPNGGGGSTNVTYNINAVDAQSFKAMIAADPSFIYAVSQQGAKGIPSRR